VEVHVDDELLSSQPDQAPAAAILLRTMADLAESKGARLSFRIRTPFARAHRDSGILPELVERGHGVGVHAHGRGFAEAAHAVRACGVEPTAAVPGLVQAGRHGRDGLLRQVGACGIGLVTDHGPHRAWAYEGLALREEAGLIVMAPTVQPFDWGLMDRDGTRHGLHAENIGRLRALEAQAASHGAAWFGVALHEHDLCPPGSLVPNAAALDALGSYLDDRVQPATHALTSPTPATSLSGDAPSDARLRLVRKLRQAAARGRQWIPSASWHRAIHGEHRHIPVGDRRIHAVRTGPEWPAAILLLCHAGHEGGCRLGLRPFGIEPNELEETGWATWAYDRTGTGRTGPAGTDLRPGSPTHVEDWCAVLAEARKEGVPIVALSWSAGIVPVLRAAAEGIRPDALVDGEGPADRWSLAPPPHHLGPEARAMASLDPWDDAAWEGREPLALLPTLGVPYARLQADMDHVHGDMHMHATRMVDAARSAGLVVRPLQITPGRLRSHPHAVMSVLSWTRDQVGAPLTPAS
jgi:sirohydrochlorin ferrochelatase